MFAVHRLSKRVLPAVREIRSRDRVRACGAVGDGKMLMVGVAVRDENNNAVLLADNDRDGCHFA